MIWIFYYALLFFGSILFLFTFKEFNYKKNRIDPNQYEETKFNAQFIKLRLKEMWQQWKFYFTDRNPKNMRKNIFYVVFIFALSLIVNHLYLNIDESFFIPLFFFVTVFGVWQWGERRTRKIFEASFPEIIQVLNSATSAGAGLLQALERCSLDVQGPLGDEFKIIHRRLAFGENVTTVFQESYDSWPFREFYYFATIIRLNMEKGGQMRDIITRLGRIITDSQKMEQKKQTMTAEARVSSIIVASFPLVFFIFMKFVLPENFEFITHNPTGLWVLYYVIASETFGMGIIYWLMKK
ncbi:protein dehydratase [Actinobacillus delphinicola]|uniref:Flp pilus assembly protein n=1 Tax=Actinobacillus delphinicola TaxID=51161 RepID=A0A448TVF3_9PAST|nr:type II secretion system F family protein [Actinobacillus delphinicola]MDG6898037.1 protein dehydratase [Actinobacillus delphinicola]VEJ09903.1 Flp pilus assembly protein [Actinobacillus delphinicola]